MKRIYNQALVWYAHHVLLNPDHLTPMPNSFFGTPLMTRRSAFILKHYWL